MTVFKGFEDFGKTTLRALLRDNLVDYLKYGLLQAGAWGEVAIASPGAADPYGRDTLVEVRQSGVAPGRLWQSPKFPRWVHEAGFGAAPSVLVNGSPASGHAVDYRNGRVLLASPAPANAVVQASHAYRTCDTAHADVSWFRPVVLDSFADDQGAGVARYRDDRTLSLPCVVVEVAGRSTQAGYQVGGGALWRRQSVTFHVLAEDGETRGRLMDLCEAQEGQEVWLYDPNLRRAAGDYELSASGARLGGTPYPGLVAASGYRWRRAFFKSCRGTSTAPRAGFLYGSVDAVIEVATLAP